MTNKECKYDPLYFYIVSLIKNYPEIRDFTPLLDEFPKDEHWASVCHAILYVEQTPENKLREFYPKAFIEN